MRFAAWPGCFRAGRSLRLADWPILPALFDGGGKLAIHGQAQAAALADQFDARLILTCRAEIGQAEFALHAVPCAADDLEGARRAGIVVDTLNPDFLARMVGIVVKQRTAHDGAVSVWPCSALADAGSFA